MPGLEYTSGTFSVGYAAKRNVDGRWSGEVRVGHIASGGEPPQTLNVPGGPWDTEAEAYEAIHSWATHRWRPTGQKL